MVAKDGPLVVITGQHTGRAAKDKFIVRDPASEKHIWWDNNQPMEAARFDALFDAMMAYAEGRELYVQDLFGGADPTHRLPVRMVTELAWHSLFIQHLLIEPRRGERDAFKPEYTIICLPGFTADPARHGCKSGTVIAVNFARKIVLIGGTSYAGEIKKSVFTILNYILPGKGVMAMHASANVGHNRDTAIFFGLSGTGKTTLSADPNRILIGDDEHGWSENGVFNFEGGCYAKMIRLSKEAEPEISFYLQQVFKKVLQPPPLSPILCIISQILRDENHFPHPLMQKSAKLLGHLFHGLAAETAFNVGNDAERASFSAPFCDL